MVLQGTEIKSIREGQVNLSDAYCFFRDNELYVRNMHIGTYKQGTHGNHEPLRIRKLLLKKTELRKIRSKSLDQGITIVPVRLFLSETGYAKLEIAVAQGKKLYDKRESLKQKDLQREELRNR